MQSRATDEDDGDPPCFQPRTDFLLTDSLREMDV